MTSRSDMGSCAGFDSVQERYADVPGEEGISLRRKHYAPYFLRTGHGVVIEEGCRFYHPDRIVLEDDSRINVGALIYGSGGVWIGRHARIGPRCLIHSANHELHESPLAFHELGYQYKPVRVGDNVLISADVGIMPGAEIGDGCFVAAGAIVPGKKFPSRARLFGVPARDMNRPAGGGETAAPDIALIVAPRDADGGEWADIARHLLGPLGLPQIAIIEAGCDLPPSVHSIIVFGPDLWKPDIGDVNRPIDVWFLVAGNVVSGAQISHALPSGELICLPEVQPIAIFRDGRAGGDYVGKLQQVLFWLGERLNKGSKPLSPSEFAEWGLLRRFAGDTAGLEAFWKRAAADLHRRGHEGAGSGQLVGRSDLPRKTVLASPEVLVQQVMDAVGQQKIHQSEKLIELTREVYEHSNTGRRLVAVGICAILLGDTETATSVGHRLEQKDWCRNGVAFPFSVPAGPGFCFSPLVAIWLLLQAREANSGFDLPANCGVSCDQSRRLPWHTLANGLFFDSQAKEISRSLVDCWLMLHSAPCPDAAQYKLESSNYAPTIAALEAIWVDVFRSIQHNKGRPVVRLRPWPAPYTAAFSLRYDVDRPVTSKRIAELVRLQSEYANAPCATWYYFASDIDRKLQTRQLKCVWQEIGLHLQNVHEAERGLGVTHHSAATSDYWRGNATNRQLDEGGVKHGEFLAAQIPTPRRSWIHSPKGHDHRGNMWISSIYFPLEGSTNNETLNHFNRLAEEFWAMLAQGSHVIVGSHPDISQHPLIELLKHDEFRHVWCATIGDVISRCLKVLEPGAIWTVEGNVDGVMLQARDPVADLVIEFWRPGEVAPVAETLQLTGVPRTIGKEAPSF